MDRLFSGIFSALRCGELQKAADLGHAEAQYDLGNNYLTGGYFNQDNSKAIYWWRKAAGSGHVKAQYNLGYCYYQNYILEHDFEQAVYWFSKAADQGLKEAQYYLGRCYEYGLHLQ